MSSCYLLFYFQHLIQITGATFVPKEKNWLVSKSKSIKIGQINTIVTTRETQQFQENQYSDSTDHECYDRNITTTKASHQRCSKKWKKAIWRKLYKYSRDKAQWMLALRKCQLAADASSLFSVWTPVMLLVHTLVFMFWENSRMVSTLVQASGWSFRLVRTSWATRCYKTTTWQTLYRP